MNHLRTFVLTLFFWLSLCFLHAQQLPHLYGYGPPNHHGNIAKLSKQVDLVGDVNRDGYSDLISFLGTSFSNSLRGNVLVKLWDRSTGTFLSQETWHTDFNSNDELPLMGDVNGDGRDDIIFFSRGSSADVYVAVSDGTTFWPRQKWHDNFCINSEIPLVADIDGDGDDDILTFTRGNSANVFIALSNGSNEFIGTGRRWKSNFCPGLAVPMVGDVNGDGRADILSFIRSSQSGSARGDVMVALSSGSNFGDSNRWHNWFALGSEVPLVGDVDGNGKDDILTFTGGSNPRTYVALSSGNQFQSATILNHDFADGNKKPMMGSFNFDLNRDLISVNADQILSTSRIEIATAGGHATANTPKVGDYGYGTMGVNWSLIPLVSRPPTTTRKLIVVLVEVPGRPSFASQGKTRAGFEKLFFGPEHPNIASYFSEMSGGKFTYENEAVFGPMQLDPDDYPSGGISGNLKEILRTQGIDFRFYDQDNNNRIEDRELSIIMVDNITDAGGVTIGSSETISYGGESIEVANTIALAGYRGVFDLFAHELSHQLATIDMYSSGCYSTRATLMHCNATTSPDSLVHLDPYHKMRLGWITPRVFDVRYPGSAFIDVAPEAAGPRSPILLKNDQRDSQEFYMVDYRNPHWTGGIQAYPNSPAAGYDVHAASRGLGLWYYQLNEISKFVVRPAVVIPGTDGVLNTTPFSGSDDLVVGNTIRPGPDGILQTFENGVLAGDDGRRDDVMAFLSSTPADYSSRASSTFYKAAQAPLSPEWFDRSPVDGGLEMLFDETLSDTGQGYVQWGNDFTPFLTGFNSPSAVGLARFNLIGTLGKDRTSIIPAFAVDDQVYEAKITSWNFETGRAQISTPWNIPAGKGRVFFYRDATRQTVSNSLAVTISNRYLDWITGYLGARLNSNPDLANPSADPDGDCWPNIAEYLIDSDPGDSRSTPGASMTIIPGESFHFQWSVVNNRIPLVRFVAETSPNLRDWTSAPIQTIESNGDRRTMEIVREGNFERLFARLRFIID